MTDDLNLKPPYVAGGPWTTHGHPVPGVTVEGNGRPPVARCGGPALCGQCGREAASLRMTHGTLRPTPEPTTPPPPGLDLGRVAFEAYRVGSSSWLSHHTTWGSIAALDREAWRACADGVRMFLETRNSPAAAQWKTAGVYAEKSSTPAPADSPIPMPDGYAYVGPPVSKEPALALIAFLESKWCHHCDDLHLSAGQFRALIDLARTGASGMLPPAACSCPDGQHADPSCRAHGTELHRPTAPAPPTHVFDPIDVAFLGALCRHGNPTPCGREQDDPIHTAPTPTTRTLINSHVFTPGADPRQCMATVQDTGTARHRCGRTADEHAVLPG